MPHSLHQEALKDPFLPLQMRAREQFSKSSFQTCQVRVVHFVSTSLIPPKCATSPLTVRKVYHIHAYPVPADGNCTGTLAHLDPYIRGETPPCDPSMPATCQVGDLSGKYGTINGTSASLTYHDPYVSLQPGLGAFFGNRSFVVHYANTTRLACANFSLVGEGMIGNPNPNNPPGPPGAGSNGNVTSTGSVAPSGGTSTVSEFPSSSSYSTSTRSTTTSTTTVSSAGKVSSSSGSAKSTGSTQGIGGTGTKSAGPATVTTNGVGRMARQLNVAAPLLLVLTMLVW
jgi:hypothetical protein